MKDESVDLILKIKSKKQNFFDIYRILIISLFILFSILIILLCLYFLLIKKYKRKSSSKKLTNSAFSNITNNYRNSINKSNTFEYFACFCGMGSQENKYARQLIDYYINIGVEKFILADNNLPNTEKLSDVLQDYISNGTVDIIELFGSTLGQSEFGQSMYEKYKTKCGWFLFFDFDEYLEVFFEKNKTLKLQQFLSSSIFSKCESILFNWLIYNDNDLIQYDNRTLLERFPIPNMRDRDNVFVKPVVRGNLNKTIFYFNTSNHVPSSNLTICNSIGKKIRMYNAYSVAPLVHKYGYLKHFTTKTVEEFCAKTKRGRPRGKKYIIPDRVKLFFRHNNFTKEKLKFLEKSFNMSFNNYRNFRKRIFPKIFKDDKISPKNKIHKKFIYPRRNHFNKKYFKTKY